MNRAAIALALLGLLAVPAWAQGKLYSNSYMGDTPPAVTSEAEDWVSGPKAGQPLAAQDMEGRVVYVEFSFLH